MSNHQILNSADHGALRVHTQAGADFGDAVMACMTVPDEFRRVQGHFPVVFRRDVESGAFSALALLGFENGENLFLEGGRWDARYRPLALAIQPFLIGRPSAQTGEAQVHVDMAHPRISADGEGVRVFDDAGQPSPYLEAIARSLGELDHGHRQSPAFFAALEHHGLLEPFTLDVPLDDGSRHSLVGFHTIDEERLAALNGKALGALHEAGHLMPIFMAMASLSHLGELVARKNARVAGG
ncbi:SapC family protein [Sandarakinorhabdus sp.]|uniref:SapC family protein n=1 Tax=Sandarakinorhabdus sp. TaxID=1916663 RepID=UPI00286E4F66|nr:SapC family protein [Sandarakinorhabdus sp.]